MTFYSYQSYSQEIKPVAWWNFEMAENGKTKEIIGNIEDVIEGNFKQNKGLVGYGIKLDGFSTRIIREAKKAPILRNEFTIEA